VANVSYAESTLLQLNEIKNHTPSGKSAKNGAVGEPSISRAMLVGEFPYLFLA
jgi:hypothetical protein